MNRQWSRKTKNGASAQYSYTEYNTWLFKEPSDHEGEKKPHMHYQIKVRDHTENLWSDVRYNSTRIGWNQMCVLNTDCAHLLRFHDWLDFKGRSPSRAPSSEQLQPSTSHCIHPHVRVLAHFAQYVHQCLYEQTSLCVCVCVWQRSCYYNTAALSQVCCGFEMCFPADMGQWWKVFGEKKGVPNKE